tara:strand:+ start:1254 stop:1676 length:423 start_codon:yes stop_codon:yes gene_type:complete
MAPAFLETIENTYKKIVEAFLPVQIRFLGPNIELFRRTENEYDAVYGPGAGLPTEESVATASTQALITGEAFTAVDESRVGTFEQGFLWIDPANDQLKVGDLINFTRQGTKIRRVMIEQKDAIGMTTVVMYRYRISTVGE